MTRKLKIKVCGMREAENIRQVEALGIDMMGFIFYPPSPRFVDVVPQYLPSNCLRTGVFVNASFDQILEKVRLFGLNAVQLHGKESAQYCSQLRGLIGPDLMLIKAVSVKDAKCLTDVSAYQGVVDLLLFDTPCDGFGGSGCKFDWSILNDYKCNIPFMLSGGIGPEAADALLAFQHPMLVGLDLNSRFEAAPALKDAKAISSFLNIIG